MKKLEVDQKGQAVVEYVLSLLMAMAVLGIIATGFRRTLIALWVGLAKDVAAPCPGCPPPPEIKTR
ncbi:MAG: hypothetical protein AAB425_06120 [Bdellovibrionota bacterium]